MPTVGIKMAGRGRRKGRRGVVLTSLFSALVNPPASPPGRRGMAGGMG